MQACAARAYGPALPFRPSRRAALHLPLLETPGTDVDLSSAQFPRTASAFVAMLEVVRSGGQGGGERWSFSSSSSPAVGALVAGS